MVVTMGQLISSLEDMELRMYCSIILSVNHSHPSRGIEEDLIQEIGTTCIRAEERRDQWQMSFASKNSASNPRMMSKESIVSTLKMGD